MTFVHDDSIVLPILKQKNLDSGRVYLVETGEHTGDVYPSITRMLSAKPKPALEAWKKRVGHQEAERIRTGATRQGTSVHTAVERYLNNQAVPSMMPNVAELWSLLRPWVDAHVTKVYGQETDVFSHRLAIAGRFDLLADVDDELTVVDFKTAKRRKIDEYLIDYKLQGTFYACAVYELTGRKVKRVILPVMYPGGLQVVECKPLDHFPMLLSRINEYYRTAV